MYFPLVLMALVAVSAVFLLRQFWARALDDADAASADAPWPDAASADDTANARDDASHDVLKAA